MILYSGCLPADAWSSMLNVPVEDILSGKSLFIFGIQEQVTFKRCDK